MPLNDRGISDYLECTIRNTFLTNINLGRLSDIASHCKKIYIYLIEITFLSQFCLFNTLFHVYPTTARKKNFAGLVKRHLAGIILRLSPPDCVVLESLAITVKSWVCFPTGLSTVKTYLIIFYNSCWINCIISYKFYQYFFNYNTYESGFESLSLSFFKFSISNFCLKPCTCAHAQ